MSIPSDDVCNQGTTGLKLFYVTENLQSCILITDCITSKQCLSIQYLVIEFTTISSCPGTSAVFVHSACAVSNIYQKMR